MSDDNTDDTAMWREVTRRTGRDPDSDADVWEVIDALSGAYVRQHKRRYEERRAWPVRASAKHLRTFVGWREATHKPACQHPTVFDGECQKCGERTAPL